MGKESQNIFGGGHTVHKLSIVSSYVHAYASVFASPTQKWATTFYLDPFAGTGAWGSVKSASQGKSPTLFAEPAQEEEPPKHSGSAELALKACPPFHRYYFSDNSAAKVAELKKLSEEWRAKFAVQFPDRKSVITVKHEDANIFIAEFCKVLNATRGGRAVAFLDPFGMKVKWSSLKLLAKTERADVWCLVPIGHSIRQLSHNKHRIDENKAKALNDFLGTEDWRLFYEKEAELMSGSSGRRDINVSGFEQYIHDRLSQIFKGLAAPPFPMYERGKSGKITRRQPYSLYCCLGNTSPQALSIAKRILADLRRKQLLTP